MPKTKPKARKCGYCRNTGHNKRSCPVFAREKIVERTKKRNLGQPISKEKKQKKSVRINFGSAKNLGAVVNLREEKEPSVLDTISVFKEDPPKKIQAKKIDFAEHIRVQKRQNSAIHKKLAQVQVNFKKGRFEQLKQTVQDIQFSRREKKQQSPQKRQREKIVEEIDSSYKMTVYPVLEEQQQRESNFGNFFQALLLPKRLAFAALVFIAFIGFPGQKYFSEVQAATDQVMNASTQAFLSLQSSTAAAFGADIESAQVSLEDALLAFSEAKTVLEQEHQLLQGIVRSLPIVGQKLQSRQALLEAGHHLAIGNTYIVKGVESSNEEDLKISDKIRTLRTHLAAAKPQYEEALQLLSSVDKKTLPVAYEDVFGEFQLLFGSFVEDLEEYIDLLDTMNSILGEKGFRRYIVVTQNSAEIRATGGFWGAAAICDFQQGEFLGCEVLGGGLYDLQGQYGEYLIPPKPLSLASGRWECHDMNWSPDFKVAAKRLEHCFENSRNITADGVIAINSSLIEDVLSITGPISNEDHGVLLSADNVLETLQYKVERDYDKELNQPKAILGDVLEQFLSHDYSHTDLLQFLTLIHQSAQEKNIQAAMNDNQVAATLAQFGWDGALVEEKNKQDYLMVVNSNILGEKSDAKMTQNIRHQVVVNEQGEVEVTVAIEREHHGIPKEPFYGYTNLNYVRIYVPEGAKLLSAEGFSEPNKKYFHDSEPWYAVDPQVKNHQDQSQIHEESGTIISEDLGKTVFENWMITNPQGTSIAYVVYTLPFTVNTQAPQTHSKLGALDEMFLGNTQQETSAYRLYVQKQSGVESGFSSRVIYPESYAPLWRSREDLSMVKNGATFEQYLTTDIQFGIIMKKE